MRSNFTPDPRTPCSAIGCSTNIPRGHLMCLRHWNMVSSTLKAEVYATVGALRGKGDLADYLIAVAGAQLNVATAEHKPQEVHDALLAKIERLRALKAAKGSTR